MENQIDRDSASKGADRRISGEHQTQGGEGVAEAILQDLRFGLRVLFKNPGFALTVLCTMGLALGATTVIYSFFHAVLLRSLPYDSPDRLVKICTDMKGQVGPWSTISVADFADWKAQSRSF